MANSIVKGQIGNALESVAPDHTVATADGIYDETAGKYQDTINAETAQNLSGLQHGTGYYECDTPADTAAKSVSGGDYQLPTTAPYGGSVKIKFDHANTAANPTLSISGCTAKPLYYDGAKASSSNTWADGETVEVYYDGTNFQANNVAGGGNFATGEKVKNVGIGDVLGTSQTTLMSQKGATDLISEYNVSVNNGNVEYTFDQAVALVPASLQKGGLTIKYIDSTTHEYAIKRLMSSTWNTAKSNWQGIDDEPTSDSNNLIKSGGVQKYLAKTITRVNNPSYTEGVMKISGTIDTSATAYGYTNAILLEKGATLILNQGYKFYHGSQVACVFKCDSNGTFESVLVSTPYLQQIITEYINTFGEDIYVGISGYKEQLRYSIEKPETAAGITDFEILRGLVEDEMSYLAENIIVIDESPSYTTGIVRPNGTIVEVSTYGYTAPILLHPNDIIYLNLGQTMYVGENVAAIYLCNENGEFLDYIIAGIGGGFYEVIKYENSSNSDIYVGICGYTNQLKYKITNLAKAASINSVNELQESVDALDDLAIKYDFIDGTDDYSSLEENKYVRYSEGNVTTAGPSNMAEMYVFNLRNLKIDNGYVKCVLGCNDSIPALIAFYKNTISSVDYIQSASIQAQPGVNTYKCDIPSDAQFMCISNFKIVLNSPIISIYRNEYINTDTFNDYEELLIASRNVAEGISSEIKIIIPFAEYQVGTQFKLKISECSKDIRVIYAYNINSLNPFVSLNKDTKLFYFQKTYENEFGIILYLPSSSSEDNIFNFEVSRVKTYSIQGVNRISPTYSVTKLNPSGPVNIGTLTNGYPISNTLKSNQYYWVSCSPQFSNGFTFHLTADFENYIVRISQCYAPDYSTNSERREISISQETDVFIPPTCFMWWILIAKKSATGGVDYLAHLDPDEIANVFTLTYVSGNLYERTLSVGDTKYLINKALELVDTDKIQSALNIARQGYAIHDFANNPYFYHYNANSFIVTPGGYKAIASESIEDIELAARLGFKFIEANIHKTLDDNFVCIHGEGGKFGQEVKSTDENVITTSDLRNTLINSVTLNWIKTYVRYDSYYEKYQTTIPSLDEFCQCCKQNNIGIFAGVPSLSAVNICIKYLSNNVIVYNAPSNIRSIFNGYVFTWNDSSSATPQGLLQAARNIGAPYMCGLGPSTISTLINNNQLDSFIQDMHSEGFLVGWAAVYTSEADGRDYIKRGMDFSGAGHEVNPFEANYEVYDIDSENLPTTTGIISNGVCTLSPTQTITAGSSNNIIGKGILYIRFNGTLVITFGSKGSYNRTITSDGSEDLVISDYFFKRGTTLTITANTNTTISNFLYKTSKC